MRAVLRCVNNWIPQGVYVRRVIGIWALLIGGARFVPYPSIDLIFGSNLLWGLALVLAGALLLATRRLTLAGKLSATLLAAVFAALGVSLSQTSLGSVLVDFFMAALLLHEARSVRAYDC